LKGICHLQGKEGAMVTPNNVVSIFSNTAQVIEALDRMIRKSRGRKRKLRLFTHIYVKIKTLKTLVDIDPENEKYRKNVRLINLRKLMILLLKHISS
jgi:hypothetical protein